MASRKEEEKSYEKQTRIKSWRWGQDHLGNASAVSVGCQDSPYPEFNTGAKT